MKTIFAIGLLAAFAVNALAQTNFFDQFCAPATNSMPYHFTAADFGVGTETNKTSCGDLLDQIYAQEYSKTNAPVAASSTPAKLREIITRSGEIYENVEISEIEPDAITFLYSNTNCIGGARILFSDLSAKIQKRFGYDPQKAVKYEQQKTRQAMADQAYNIQVQRAQNEANLEIAEQKYKDAQESYNNYLRQEQADAAQRIADAQERQAAALEDQTFQQEMDAIETQGKLDDIDWDLSGLDWDLNYGYRY